MGEREITFDRERIAAFLEALEARDAVLDEALSLLKRAVAGEFGVLPAKAWDTFHDFLHRAQPQPESEGS